MLISKLLSNSEAREQNQTFEVFSCPAHMRDIVFGRCTWRSVSLASVDLNNSIQLHLAPNNNQRIAKLSNDEVLLTQAGLKQKLYKANEAQEDKWGRRIKKELRLAQKQTKPQRPTKTSKT